MTSFEYAVCATRGDRSYQEDAAVFWPGPATFKLERDLPSPPAGTMMAILADGMGGHAGGAEASRAAVHAFIEELETPINRDTITSAIGWACREVAAASVGASPS